MNTEIDQVIEQTTQLLSEIENFKTTQRDQDLMRRSTIDDMQQRLAGTLDVTRGLEEQNSVQQESVSQISKKVGTLFFKLSCDQMDTKGSQANAKNQRFATSRPESKATLLTGQGVTESNVLDYLGCIEQRAVDIISEYLHIINTREANQGPGAHMRITGGGPRSPTPGPSSPMVWHGREPLVELDCISDDDLLEEGREGEDNKPVDLSSYKTKLQRKLGLGSSLGASGEKHLGGGTPGGGGGGGGATPGSHHMSKSQSVNALPGGYRK
jgi:hypothetical protein